jgi:hypothetical protein
VNNLYHNNYKTLKKETEEDTGSWKDLPCSWTGRTVKMAVLLKAIYRLNAIHVKIPMSFTETEKFIWKHKSL